MGPEGGAGWARAPGVAGDVAVFHAAFAVVALAVLGWPTVVVASQGTVYVPPPVGWRVLGLVVLYNVALPLVGRWRGRAGWVRLWAFLAPLSAFQVVPDVFLAGVLGTLDFPDTGGPRLGPVPLALAGMWTVPLWISTWAGLRAQSVLVAAAVAGALFVSAEATLWAVPIWLAVGVTALGPVALYVVPAEVVLGGAAYAAFRWSAGRPWPVRGAAAGAVSVLYLGAACAAYLLVEGVAS